MELTNEEKFSIVTSHLKNCMSNIYNLQITLLEETSVDEVNQDNVDAINKKIASELSKREALLAEIESLNING